MEKLVEKGLVRSIGISNFNSAQINDILSKCKVKPTVNQVECHPYFNQAKLIAFCKEKDIVVTAYSPLGAPARPWASAGEPGLLDEPKLTEIGKNYGKTAAHVLIRWQVRTAQ
jgi:aldehyde reductase